MSSDSATTGLRDVAPEAASEFVTTELGRCRSRPLVEGTPLLGRLASASCIYLLGSVCSSSVCWLSLFSALVVTPPGKASFTSWACVELHGGGHKQLPDQGLPGAGPLWLPWLCLPREVLTHREQQPRAGELPASCRKLSSGVRASYRHNENLSLQQ